MSRDTADERCPIARSDRLENPLKMVYDQRQSQFLVQVVLRTFS